MTKQEQILSIALELYKFGKADTIEEAFKLAEEFYKSSGMFDSVGEKKCGEAIKIGLKEKEERTKKRVQEIIDLGFEYNDNNNVFIGVDGSTITNGYIEESNDHTWDKFVCDYIPDEPEPVTVVGKNSKIMEDDYENNKESYPLISDDIFKGKTYIEFISASKQSSFVLYRLDDYEKAIDETGQPLSSVREHIENKEHGLGLTIFKK